MMKNFIIPAFALALSACGFTPVHAPSMADASTAFDNIRVELAETEYITDQESGYYLQQHLKDRLGANNGQHILRVTPKTSRGNYGLSSRDVATRYDMRMNVDYVLLDSDTGEELYSGDTRAISTFGSPVDPYSRIASQRTAAEQVAREAADRILLQLASYYKDPERAERERAERMLERQRLLEEELLRRENGGDPIDLIDPDNL